MKNSNRYLIFIFALLTVAVACSNRRGGPSDGAEAASNASESAMATVGGITSASEGASGPSVQMFSTCSFATARSSCTAGLDTINWAGCSATSLSSLTGGWTELWAPAGRCSGAAMTTTADSVTRKSAGQTLALYSGANMTLDTAAHTAWDGTSIPNTGIIVTLTSTGTNNRTIAINGLRKRFYGPYGKEWFDHSLVSPTSGPTMLTVTGSRAATNRTVSGEMTVYHNLAKFIATHTFNAVVWGSTTCCYPTQGTITTVLTGSVTGTRTLDFTAGAVNCGAATFTDTNAATSTIYLTMCE